MDELMLDQLSKEVPAAQDIDGTNEENRLPLHEAEGNVGAEELDVHEDGAEDDKEDLSSHVFLLNQQLTVDGECVLKYFCPHCNKDYNSVKEFAVEHPGVLFMENLDEISSRKDVPATDEKSCSSWIDFDANELIEQDDCVLSSDNKVEEETTILFDPSATGFDEGCLFYCNKCHQEYNESSLESGEHNCYSGEWNAIPASKEDCIDAELEVEKELDLMLSFMYTCAHCSKKFTSAESRLKHAGKCFNQEKPNVFYCPICGNEHINIRSFKCHVRKCHQLSNTSTKDTPKNAKLNSDKNQEAFCNICNTTFSSEKNLKMHIKMHGKRDIRSIQEALPLGSYDEYSELKTFYCDICDKSFDQNLLKVHENMHLNVGDHICKKCNRVFEDADNFSIHLQMHIKNGGKTEAISTKQPLLVTPNEFSQPKRNAQDEETERKEKSAAETTQRRSYSCQYCGKEFPRPYLKVKHERVHTGEKPYACEVCGKSFRVSYSLTLHLRTHTNIRPYVCAKCDKRFKSNSTYVHHLNTHKTERSYKCNLCEKTFRTSVQLCCHKNGHTKPFNCSICSRGFGSMTAVRLHMETHRKPKVNFNCDICGSTYERISALHNHLKQVHNWNINAKDFKNRKKEEMLQHGRQAAQEYDVALETELKAQQQERKQVIQKDVQEQLEKSINDIHETTVATQSIIQNDAYFFLNQLNFDEFA